MSAVVVEGLSGLLRGVMFGTVGFFTVMVLSIVYRYFTNEKLSSFLGILFGLGVLGFSGGLLSILDNPTLGGAIEVVTISIFTVTGLEAGKQRTPQSNYLTHG